MRTVQASILRVWNAEEGQDVSEYSLLLAFIFLISLCLYMQNSRNISAIWTVANQLASQGASRFSSS
jgi:hypothetical protein